MSAATQYKSLLEKVANKDSLSDVEAVYRFCMSKQAGLKGDLLLAAAGGALPAYLYGASTARDEERRKHRNYALAGAAAGFLGPKLISAIVNPAEAFPSTSGFDASDIKNLQLESLD
jgi:hypothetical protein